MQLGIISRFCTRDPRAVPWVLYTYIGRQAQVGKGARGNEAETQGTNKRNAWRKAGQGVISH